MTDSIFTKIIRGEIPSYKIYKDDKTYAFLDIMPVQPGHVLVVSKSQTDKFYDLSDEDYEALFASVKKIAKHMEQALGKRVTMKIEGFDVPHAHVHLIPADNAAEFNAKTIQSNDDDSASIAAKLQIK